MKTIFGIACYHRPECKTLHTLLDIGIPKERIVIAVNCPEDNGTYSERYGDSVRIIYRDKKNVAGNRNNMLDEIEGDVVLLDDDIKAFRKYDRGASTYGRFIEASGEELDEMLEECFGKARETGSALFGFASTDNTMIAAQNFDKHFTYSLNGNFQGGFCGYIDRSIRHDEEYDVLDDYELNLRILAEGGSILRRNDWYAEKGKMAGNAGGCKALYEGGAQHRCMRQLERQWGCLFKTMKADKGIRVTCAKVEGME